jgi:hypothetical protein
MVVLVCDRVQFGTVADALWRVRNLRDQAFWAAAGLPPAVLGRSGKLDLSSRVSGRGRAHA